MTRQWKWLVNDGQHYSTWPGGLVWYSSRNLELTRGQDGDGEGDDGLKVSFAFEAALVYYQSESSWVESSRVEAIHFISPRFLPLLLLLHHLVESTNLHFSFYFSHHTFVEHICNFSCVIVTPSHWCEWKRLFSRFWRQTKRRRRWRRRRSSCRATRAKIQSLRRTMKKGKKEGSHTCVSWN